jgi:hypothetical protein
MFTGAALKKLILERLPQEILKQKHVVDLTGKTDQEIITIITKAGRTAEKWDAAGKILGLKACFKSYERSNQNLRGGKIKPEGLSTRSSGETIQQKRSSNHTDRSRDQTGIILTRRA